MTWACAAPIARHQPLQPADAHELRTPLLGLDRGADDYFCKPFSPREVVVRIQALLRRAQGSLAAQVQHAAPNGSATQTAAALVADDASLSIRWNGQLLPPMPVEFRLLRLLDHLHHDLRRKLEAGSWRCHGA